MGRAAVKKHNKPGSQPKRRKGHAAPLPLDTSRSRRPAAPNQAAAPKRAQPKHRPASVARHASRPWSATLPGLWTRLTTLSRADRADAAMLALPILLLAFTIAVGRWTNADQRTTEVATITPGAKRALTGLPTVATPVTALPPAERAQTQSLPVPDTAPAVPTFAAPVEPAVPDFDRLAAAPETPDPATSPPAVATPVAAANPGINLPARAPDAQPIAGSDTGPAEPIRAGKIDPVLAPPLTPAEQKVAILTPDRAASTWELPGGVEAIATGLGQCRFDPAPPRTPIPVSFTPSDPDSFGLALATAARSQLTEFVIYNDRYTRLKYPMGDVHPMYGVCTDVVIRAYRALGLDLQELVQKTKTGSGDPNIDHRRVDTLRKFFSRFGESLPISSFAEDFKPGDIVTYWRPQNRHSRTHIAVVSDITGPSGRPLIIHNRGWGPQQEDGLFVDQITGHYRFSGLKGSATASQAPAPPAAGKSDPDTSKKAPNRPVVRTGLTTQTQPPL
jgi:uncharacterized protein YijF (DUF1287 family)